MTQALSQNGVRAGEDGRGWLYFAATTVLLLRKG